jgi:phosphoribosylaminoimidazole (AIR) synthetase
MAITFTWSVKDMHKVTDTGAVYRVDWSCSGVDADTEVSHSRSGSYLHTNSGGEQATPDHTASGFTAYADLTEADVLAWCKADGVGTKAEALITSNITNKIAAQVNSTGMPWAAE